MTAGAIPVPLIIPLRVPEKGRSKFHIDSNTKIELRTTCEHASIFYTVNGLRPDPFQYGDKTQVTLKYKRPFTLPSGKIVLKVLAALPDGKESAVNTKQLIVDYVDAVEYVNTHMKMDSDSKVEFPVKIDSDQLKPKDSARFTSNRKSLRKSTDLSLETFSSTNLPPAENELPTNPKEVLRAARETDFLKCIVCHASRPADPYARFCTECGYPVPPITNKKLPPPEPGQMGTCIKCHNTVPLNTDRCLICEADLFVQMQPQASLKMEGVKYCSNCNTANPPVLSVCVRCECALGPVSKIDNLAQSSVPLPSVMSRLSCSKCGRVNSSDARFCDWCGSKPKLSKTTLNCTRCTASNQIYAKFCLSCGYVIDPPLREEVSACLKSTSSEAEWLAVSKLNSSNKKYCTASTQTVGLYYPSNRALETAFAEDESRKVFKVEKKIPLSSISPGRGYWRQNIDFICAHLKAYAQNNLEFRTLTGDHKLGKLMCATLHEDGHELSLTLNFPVRSDGKGSEFKGKNLNLVKNSLLTKYSDTKQKYFSDDNVSVNSATSDETIGTIASFQEPEPVKIKKKTKTKKIVPTKKLTAVDRLLFAEVDEKGDGNADVIKQLIDEGGNIYAKNNDVSLVEYAIKYFHLDAAAMIIQCGFGINSACDSFGNTPLHVAIQTTPCRKPMVERLLSLGAKPKKKNTKGISPYDAAVQRNLDEIVTLLASHLGQEYLNKLTQL